MMWSSRRWLSRVLGGSPVVARRRDEMFRSGSCRVPTGGTTTWRHGSSSAKAATAYSSPPSTVPPRTSSSNSGRLRPTPTMSSSSVFIAESDVELLSPNCEGERRGALSATPGAALCGAPPPVVFVSVDGAHVGLRAAVMESLDVFVKSRVSNFVARHHSAGGGPGVKTAGGSLASGGGGASKGDAVATSVRCLDQASASGHAGWHVATVRLRLSALQITELAPFVDRVFPEDGGAQAGESFVDSCVIGRGIARYAKDAEVAALMHVERLLDHAGFAIFALASKQLKHAEAARGERRWAPMPGDPPGRPNGTGRADSFDVPLPIVFGLPSDGAADQGSNKVIAARTFDQGAAVSAPSAAPDVSPQTSAWLDAMDAGGLAKAQWGWEDDATEVQDEASGPLSGSGHICLPPSKSNPAPPPYGRGRPFPYADYRIRPLYLPGQSLADTPSLSSARAAPDESEGGRWLLVEMGTRYEQPSHCILSPHVYDWGAAWRRVERCQGVHRGADGADIDLGNVDGRVVLSRHGTERRSFLAFLPLRPQGGGCDVAARGIGPTEEVAKHLCGMHLELLCDALGIPLFDDPKAQRQHVGQLVDVGREFNGGSATTSSEGPSHNDPTATPLETSRRVVSLPRPLKAWEASLTNATRRGMQNRRSTPLSHEEAFLSAHHQIANTTFPNVLECHPCDFEPPEALFALLRSFAVSGAPALSVAIASHRGDSGPTATSGSGGDGQPSAPVYKYPAFYLNMNYSNQWRCITLLPLMPLAEFGIRGGYGVAPTPERAKFLSARHGLESLVALGINPLAWCRGATALDPGVVAAFEKHVAARVVQGLAPMPPSTETHEAVDTIRRRIGVRPPPGMRELGLPRALPPTALLLACIYMDTARFVPVRDATEDDLAFLRGTVDDFFAVQRRDFVGDALVEMGNRLVSPPRPQQHDDRAPPGSRPVPLPRYVDPYAPPAKGGGSSPVQLLAGRGHAVHYYYGPTVVQGQRGPPCITALLTISTVSRHGGAPQEGPAHYVVACGRASNRVKAERLCLLHALRVLDRLGVAVFPSSPEKQAAHDMRMAMTWPERVGGGGRAPADVACAADEPWYVRCSRELSGSGVSRQQHAVVPRPLIEAAVFHRSGLRTDG